MTALSVRIALRLVVGALTLTIPRFASAGDDECSAAAAAMHQADQAAGFDNVGSGPGTCGSLAAAIHIQLSSEEVLGANTVDSTDDEVAISELARSVEAPVATTGTGASADAVPTSLPVAVAGYGIAPVPDADSELASRWAIFASLNPSTVFRSPEDEPTDAQQRMERADVSAVGIFDLEGERDPYFGVRLRYNFLASVADCPTGASDIAASDAPAICQVEWAVERTLAPNTSRLRAIESSLSALADAEAVAECGTAIMAAVSIDNRTEAVLEGVEAACGGTGLDNHIRTAAEANAGLADALDAYRDVRVPSFFGLDLRLDIGDAGGTSSPATLETDFGVFLGVAGGYRWTLSSRNESTIGIRGATGMSHVDYSSREGVAAEELDATLASPGQQMRVQGQLGVEILGNVGQDFVAFGLGAALDTQRTDGTKTCIDGSEHDFCWSVVTSLSIPVAEGHRLSLAGSRLVSDPDSKFTWTISYNSQMLWQSQRRSE